MSVHPVHPNLQLSDHPLAAAYLRTLRDRGTDKAEFRKAVRRLAPFVVMQATSALKTVAREVETPLSVMAPGVLLKGKVALVPVLRAGLSMLETAEDLLPDNSPVWMYGARRDEKLHQAECYYRDHIPAEIPDSVQLLLVLDPMLATAGTASDLCVFLKERLRKKDGSVSAADLRVVCLIAAPEGVERMRRDHPDVSVHAIALDEKLNENAYIVPGLGDAGDRRYGTT